MVGIFCCVTSKNHHQWKYLLKMWIPGWLTWFILYHTGQRTKPSHADARLVKRRKGSEWEAWTAVKRGLERRNDVIPGGCRHYAFGAVNRCTDGRPGMNTLMWPTETTRNSIYIAQSSNIGTQVDVKLIKNCTTKQHVKTKTSALGLKMKHIRQHSWASTGLTVNSQTQPLCAESQKHQQMNKRTSKQTL